MAKEESEVKTDDSPLLLMMVTDYQSSSDGKWYLDSGRSNHIIGHRDWFKNCNEKKSRVGFADNRFVQAKGTGDVLVRRKDGMSALISDVLFVPSMTTNLISLGQLIEKGFSLGTKEQFLEIFDPSKS